MRLRFLCNNENVCSLPKCYNYLGIFHLGEQKESPDSTTSLSEIYLGVGVGYACLDRSNRCDKPLFQIIIPKHRLTERFDSLISSSEMHVVGIGLLERLIKVEVISRWQSWQ